MVIHFFNEFPKPSNDQPIFLTVESTFYSVLPHIMYIYFVDSSQLHHQIILSDKSQSLLRNQTVEPLYEVLQLILHIVSHKQLCYFLNIQLFVFLINLNLSSIRHQVNRIHTVQNLKVILEVESKFRHIIIQYELQIIIQLFIHI